MIVEAKSRGIHVFVGTLLPQRPGGSRASAAALIPEANAHIRALARAENVTLVDLYEGFGRTPDPFIDVDGLHPTEAGYAKIAELYFGTIRQAFELPPGAAPAGLVWNAAETFLPLARPR
jgi:lysophospholipase L1-like esterase